MRKKSEIKMEKSKKNTIINIIFIIAIVTFMCFNFIAKEVSDLDELWNYNFASNIANGLVPYRDFNMIITPTLSIVCGLILKIFGKELIIMRILAIILNSGIIYMIYKIQKKLDINLTIRLGTTTLIIYMLKNLFAIDYNFSLALMFLIILNIEIKKERKEIKLQLKYDLILGILLGICITLKQTVGTIITIAFSGYFVLLGIKNKEAWKILLIRLIGASIPVFSMLIYLALNDALYEFFDYCILGVKTFSNSISYQNLIEDKNIVFKVSSIVLPITVLVIGIYGIIKKDTKAIILFAASISQFILAIPISDKVHFSVAVIPSIISFSYLLKKTIEKIDIKRTNFISIFINTQLTLIFIIIFAFLYSQAVQNAKNININTEIKHYKYLNLPQYSIKDIKEMDEFIISQSKDVYILDFIASYYMIPIDRYTKDFDMFNLGNFGSKGEQGQIEKIQKTENAMFLIRKDGYRRNWQNPENVREYVKNNMTKTGEIGAFDIYE